MGKHVVMLNEDRIEGTINKKHSLIIAEALLQICGLTNVSVDHRNGFRTYTVKTMPRDVPQANIYWINAESYVNRYLPQRNNPEELRQINAYINKIGHKDHSVPIDLALDRYTYDMVYKRVCEFTIAAVRFEGSSSPVGTIDFASTPRSDRGLSFYINSEYVDQLQEGKYTLEVRDRVFIYIKRMDEAADIPANM